MGVVNGFLAEAVSFYKIRLEDECIKVYGDAYISKIDTKDNLSSCTVKKQIRITKSNKELQ